MRIVALSDTHYSPLEITVPDGDILIHSGDATENGSFQEMKDFISWFSALPHKHKIFVPGNHDFCLDKHMRVPQFDHEIFETHDINLLIYKSITINGLNFLGAPLVSELPGWAFSTSEENIAKYLRLVKEHKNNVDVFISHEHPYNGLYGSKAILNCMKNRDELIAPIWFTGHIHSEYGVSKYGKVNVYNSAICGDHMQHINAPLVIDI